MIFFGTLFLGTMAYGVAMVLGGVTLPFYHPVLKKVGEGLTDSLDKTSKEVFHYVDGEGFTQTHNKFSFRDNLPFVLEFENVGQDEVADVIFLLTADETDLLNRLVTPLAYFEQYSQALPPNIRSTQRNLLLTPILDFLREVPDVRRRVYAP